MLLPRTYQAPDDPNASTAVAPEPTAEEQRQTLTEAVAADMPPDDPEPAPQEPVAQEPTPEAPPVQQPGESNTQFLNRLRNDYQLDLTGKYATDAEAAQAFVEHVRLSGRQANELGQLRQYAYELEQRLQQPAQPQPAPAAEPVDERAWNPPKLDQRLHRYIDQEGNVKDDTPLAARQQIEDFVAFRQDWLRKLQEQPDEALAPILADRLKPYDKKLEDLKGQIVEQIRGELQNWDQTQRTWSQAEQIKRENAGWLYAHNDKGQPVYDLDPSGNAVPRLSPQGMRYVGHMRYFAEKYPTADQSDAHTWAINAMVRENLPHARGNGNGNGNGNGHAPAPQSQPAPAPVAAAPPSLNSGTQTAPEPPTGMSLREILNRKYEQAGIGPDGQIDPEHGVFDFSS